MWDFNIGATFAAMGRTLPFIVLRMIVYFGIALSYVIAVGAGGAIGFGFGSIGGDADARAAGAFWGALIGFGGVSGVLYFARARRARCIEPPFKAAAGRRRGQSGISPTTQAS